MIAVHFSLPKIQDGRHIVLSIIGDLLKKTKILGTGNCLVVESKMYFLAKPMESSTYLDHQYFIILN